LVIQYDQGGFLALESKIHLGSEPIIIQAIDDCLKKVTLEAMPTIFGYGTDLWKYPILVELIEQEHGMTFSETF